MKIRKNYLLLLLLLASFSFVSCSDDDDDAVIAPTGSIMVEDQTLMNNTLSLSNVEISEDGWVVVYKDDGSGAMGTEVVGYEMVEAGAQTDVMVQLNEGVQLEDMEMLWVVLHTDDGDGNFEWNGTTGADAPLMEGTTPVAAVVEISIAPTGSLTVADQVLTNNHVMVESITLDRSGYVVVHADNGSNAPVVPEIISKPVYLEAGTHEDVEIPLKDDANVAANDMLWVMLHTDTGTEEMYEFDGQNGFDLPIKDEEGNIVMESITITDVAMMAVTGSLSVEDQALTNNKISIGTIELNQSGWVVVHANNDGAPVVPEIISMPVYLEAGTHTDVEVTFKDSANLSAGDMVWVMLHNDTGADDVYEFNGTNGLDLPILDDSGNIVMTSITLE